MSASASTSSKPVGSSVEPCPLEKSTILVQVQREDTKQFLGGVDVKLDGPTNGNAKTSAGSGIVLFDPVDPGSYQSDVTLAGKQSEEFEKPEPVKFSVERGEDKAVLVEVRRIMHWVAIALVDQDNQPVSGARYRVTLPDGAVREGRLDAGGSARLEDIHPGNCKISFPDYDGDDLRAIQGA